jgi:molecular chaperone DnaK
VAGAGGLSGAGGVPAAPAPHPPCRDCQQTLALAVRANKDLGKTLDRLAVLAAHPLPTPKETGRAADTYRTALLKLLGANPSLAVCLSSCYESRIPAAAYTGAFGRDAGRLAELASRGNADVLIVVAQVASRLGLTSVLDICRGRLPGELGRQPQAEVVTAGLARWRALNLLDLDLLTAVVRNHLALTSLEQGASVWSSFFHHLPASLLPPLFEVHAFLGRGADAVRLADTPAQGEAAVECCLRSPRVSDVEAGLDLARRLGSATVRSLHDRAAELHFGAGRYAEALAHYQVADRPHQVSECHERLGRVREAMDCCPGEEPDRLARLVACCLPEVDALAERCEYTEAAVALRGLLDNLNRATETTAAVSARLDELTSRRAALLVAGRTHYAGLARAATPADEPAAHAGWSRFEEAAGEFAQAARQAEKCGDLYRAHRLYRRAEQYAQAERVLAADTSSEGLAARAASLAAGGDPGAAARLYEEAGRDDDAVELFVSAGEFAAAARCLLRRRGDDAVEDPRLADYLRRAGDVDQLVRLCLHRVEHHGPTTRALDELRRLRADACLPEAFQARVAEVLAESDRERRKPFEARAAAWVAQARARTDKRFAGIWGLDLGTHNCVAAIFDTRTGRAVRCPWKGDTQFAATLSMDVEGNERVGLAGEEILAEHVLGHISGSKRRMGTRTVYRIRERTYRPEEVAARLIRHARGLVEDFLAGQVREVVGKLARAELGEVSDEWLSWLEQHHDLRLTRDRVVLTIPAYFLNNQKHSTRDACTIAGVEAVRLIHEPTAACMSAARQRGLTGQVVVVDLGAGTLDVSVLDVDENLYEVTAVMGNTSYGGKDFDEAIRRALVAKLERQGLRVPQTGKAGRRLAVAAEYLKIVLSSQEQADYPLVGFAGNQNVRLTLDRGELADILAGQLQVLRETCERLRAGLAERPRHLVLVGGPMLAPPVRSLVENVFDPHETTVVDPRTAVASGAAVQAAVLDGKLSGRVLLDVTPLPLGILVVEDGQKTGFVRTPDRETFSTVIDRNTHIPVERTKEYTTHEDNQRSIDVEIFNGSIDPAAKIGQFRLDGIRPAPRGEPRIQVTFAIDASCVLEVTARDVGTGRSNSVRVNDTTLLSPSERDAMARRFQQQRETAQQQAEMTALRARIEALIADAETDDADTALRTFEDLLAAFRPPVAPLEAQTQQTLAEMFNPAVRTELAMDLRLVGQTACDLVAKAKEYLDLKAAGADPAEGRHLATELARLVRRRQELLGWIRHRKSLLVSLAASVSDPIGAFRSRFGDEDFAGALKALGSRHPDDPADLRRLLHCLAEVGETDRYRQVLVDCNQLLPAVLLDPADPEAFLRRSGSAFVQVAATRPDGARILGVGFLVSERLVVTNRRWVIDRSADTQRALPPDRVDVLEDRRGDDPGCPDPGQSEQAPRSVKQIFLPEAPHVDLAVIELAEPAPWTALRLGYPQLLGIGHRVWALSTPPPHYGDIVPPGPAGHGVGRFLLPGVVEKFESFPEHGLALIKAGLSPPTRSSGGPLLNDLGEAVGILTVRGSSAVRPMTAAADDAIFALSVDMLSALLEQAGLHRYETG